MKIKLLKIYLFIALISFQCLGDTSSVKNNELVIKNIIGDIVDGNSSTKYLNEHIESLCELDGIYDIYFNAIKYKNHRFLNIALENCFSSRKEEGKTYKLAKYSYNTNDIESSSIFIINDAFHFNSEDERKRVFTFIYKNYLISKSRSPWVKSALDKLLANGLDPNFIISETTTPINLAILYDNTEMFELILQYGASANQVDGTIESPVEYALSKEALDTQMYYVSLLVKHGFDIKKNWHLVNGSKVRLDDYAKSMYEIDERYCLILEQYICPEGK